MSFPTTYKIYQSRINLSGSLLRQGQTTRAEYYFLTENDDTRLILPLFTFMHNICDGIGSDNVWQGWQ